MISDLNRYTVFLAVVKAGSFTEAAKELFLTQSAVSQSIAKLEEALGCRLFERSARGLRLTSKGEILAGHVKNAMRELEFGEHGVVAEEVPREEITIGVVVSTIGYGLLPRIQKFRINHPDVKVTLRGGSANELFGMLDEGLIEAAFLPGPIPAGYSFLLTSHMKVQDHLYAAVDYELPKLPRSGRYALADLKDYPFIVHEASPLSKGTFEEWFLSENQVFEPRYTVHNSWLSLRLIESGAGIGVLSDFYAREELANGRIREVPVSHPPKPRSLYLAENPRMPMSELCREFFSGKIAANS